MAKNHKVMCFITATEALKLLFFGVQVAESKVLKVTYQNKALKLVKLVPVSLYRD